MTTRFLGIDVGAETIKAAELLQHGERFSLGRRRFCEHNKEPGQALLRLLEEMDWEDCAGAVVTGRFARLLRLPRVPVKQAQAEGFRHLFDERPVTVVSVGGHGFSVLEIKSTGLDVLRENSRCSQGTGNFLRQLVARLQLSIEEASALCASVDRPVSLSGRCPVILKTDMTHLANKGEDRARILAGLYDALCENVLALLKRPSVSREAGGR